MVPATPTGIGVIPGDGDVVVSWSTPSDGGSPITSYVVTSYVGGAIDDSESFASSATSADVEGLTNGTPYDFTVAATNAVGIGPPSGLSPEVTPLAPSLSIVNGGTAAGRAQPGDQIIVTFSPAPSPQVFCSTWSTSSAPDLVGPNVVIEGTQPSSGDDTVSVTDSADCNGGFQFGIIDLGQRGYFSGNASFGGSVTGCNATKTVGCSVIHWDGSNTLTITLGRTSIGQPTRAAPSVAVYSPAPTLDVADTISSAKEEHF
jgi:hypothetical protein